VPRFGVKEAPRFGVKVAVWPHGALAIAMACPFNETKNQDMCRSMAAVDLALAREKILQLFDKA
jgi:hypothetical protein